MEFRRSLDGELTCKAIIEALVEYLNYCNNRRPAPSAGDAPSPPTEMAKILGMAA